MPDIVRARTPRALQLLPFITWTGSTDAVHLTFDDGPWPGLTPDLVATLDKYGATATFFCQGRNVERNRAEFELLVEAGHSIGTHSYSHPDGWRTRPSVWLADVERAIEIVGDALGERPALFRPPYGHITPDALRRLRRQGQEIVLWDVASFDYDPLAPARVAANVTSNVEQGSIVLLHDGPVSEERIVEALDLILNDLTDRGFRFTGL